MIKGNDRLPFLFVSRHLERKELLPQKRAQHDISDIGHDT
jgi:hypothetical protein